MKNLGDSQVIAIDFTTPQTFAKSGAILTNAIIQNKKMVYTVGGLKLAKNLDFLFTTGGTIRIRFFNSNTGNDNRRTFLYQKDADNRIIFATNETGQVCSLALELAGTEGAYSATTTDPKIQAEWTIVLAPSGAKLTLYKNGVYVGVWGAQAVLTTTAIYNTICMGDTDVLDPTGECDILEVYSSQFTAEEVLDAYENDSYTEIDSSKMDVHLPCKSWFNNGTYNVTKNLGTGGDFKMGNGLVSTNAPTQVYPKGLLMGTTQYLQAVSNYTFSATKTFSIMYLIDYQDIATAATHYNINIGTYTTNGFFLNQYGSSILGYWNSAGGNFSFAGLKRGYNVVAVTVNAGIVTGYIDGKIISTTDLSAVAGLEGALSIYLGASATSVEGILKDLKMDFSRAWTPTQVRNLSARMLESINK